MMPFNNQPSQPACKPEDLDALTAWIRTIPPIE
jgi:hypothetical protein